MLAPERVKNIAKKLLRIGYPLHIFPVPFVQTVRGFPSETKQFKTRLLRQNP
jgi:hypothetical protein